MTEGGPAPQRLHLGITPWQLVGATAQSIGEQASFAEQLGYHSFWLAENHFAPHALPDPLMMLTAAAGVTQRIRLGTTSFLITLRNPLQAAEQVAVLDQLSEGRVLLGMGRGYAPQMLQAFQVPIKEKRRIFAWTLELMQRAWAGEAISLDGDPAHAVAVHPLPVQRPHPPLWVAAFGPKALAQAGTLGLPYLSSPMESLGTLVGNYDVHAAAAQAAGHQRSSTVPLMRTIFVGEDPAQVANLRQRMQAEYENTRLLPGETLDDWALIGDPEFVREGVARYRERLGMTHLIATRLRLPGVDAPAHRRSATLLAETLVDR